MGCVIGSGTIANRFSDYSLQSRYLVFAGNVHDSGLADERVFREEEALLRSALAEHAHRTFLYFSTCSILDPEAARRPYARHKADMERLVQESARRHLILRLPQLLGLGDAPTSLVNHLVSAILGRTRFQLWGKAVRNLIDVDDVHEIVGELLAQGAHLNTVVNVASPVQTPVPDLVMEIEAFLGVPAEYELVDTGSPLEIDISTIAPIIQALGLDFGPGHIAAALDKYYGHQLCAPRLLSVIVPTYNEEHGIEEFYRRTKAVMAMLAPRFEHEFLFINDCSTDNTLFKLRLLAQADQKVKIINFSRNFGNQIAITAGVEHCRGDIAVIIDDDLQDPPEIILNLLAKWDKGYQVVYGVRPNRKGVNPVFKLTAKLYYRFIGGLSDTKIPRDTGDFRLIDRKVIDTLRLIKEESRYYRGLVSWVGFRQIGVVYERDKRYAGVSTFSLAKYINFALNGITSFTEKPLYFSSVLGSLITLVSFILALVLVINKIMDPTISIQGWTSQAVMILFFGGVQLISVGIIGVYVSKIYREVKGRPLYIVESTRNLEPGEPSQRERATPPR